jgi:hypothetical protein
MKSLMNNRANENKPSACMSFNNLGQRASACEAKLETLKRNLVWTLSEEFSDVPMRLVRQAVDEADALAALTSFPHLVLPTLAQEKVLNACKWIRRQQQVFERTSLAFAA